MGFADSLGGGAVCGVFSVVWLLCDFVIAEGLVLG